MSLALYWFRNDLRLLDNPALVSACTNSTQLLPVYCHDPAGDATTAWGFERMGGHRRQVLAATLADLATQLRARGSDLIELHGRPQDVLPDLARQLGASRIVCETIAAPEEQAEVTALRAAGLRLDTIWQSTLLDPTRLPFPSIRLPDMFTTFRHAVEKAAVRVAAPLPVPAAIPPLPTLPALLEHRWQAAPLAAVPADARSAFPYQSAAFAGGASAASAHLAQYFARKLAHTYKDTRNGLIGADYSTKFSPWLASGALSPRSVYAALQQFEAAQGANDSTYWIWFELLWRDYFHFLHMKYGRKLYRARGLSDDAAPPRHHAAMFARWCRGATGEPLVDAGMRELAATGYLSNRLRQNVASFLIHDLGGDWRAGAAWFEAQLVDYDVCSNQGNWLYLAGRGTDPRSGRRFNPQKQARDYDADGAYRALWAVA